MNSSAVYVGRPLNSGAACLPPRPQVVCRQLGYKRASQVFARATFGRGSGDIWLDNVQCIGSELSLDRCPNNGWGNHNCRHTEDAGVRCEGGREWGVNVGRVRGAV